MWLPDHIDRITLKYRIGSDQRKFFLDALLNQDAIEGIAMMHRQSFYSQDMIEFNGEDLDPVLGELSHQIRTGGLRKRQLACFHFNQNLPNARRTQPEVVRASKRSLYQAGELLIIRNRPQKSGRVEKRVHFQKRYSISLGRGSLKSSGTVNSPLADPRTLILGCSFRG